MNRRRSLAGLWLLGVVAIGPAAGCLEAADPEIEASAESAASDAAALASAFFYLRSNHNAMCLQPENGSVDDVPIVMQPCTFHEPTGPVRDSQSWTLIRISGSDYNVINKTSGKCLYENQEPLIENGLPLVQAECNSTSNELWKLTPSSIGRVMSRLGHRDSNFCIGAPMNGFPIPGLAVQMFICRAVSWQNWEIFRWPS